MQTFEQHPSEVIAYRQALTEDKVINSMWSISPPGPRVDLHSQSDSATVAMVSGLEAGKKYTLTVLITTEQGQVFERSAIIRCQ